MRMSRSVIIFCILMENYLFQFQQWRLIPYLAAAYALHHFSRSFFANFMELQMGMMMKDTSQRQVRSNFCFLTME